MDPETAPSTPLIPPKTPLPKKFIILGSIILLAIILFSLSYFKILNFNKPSPKPPSQIASTPVQSTKWTLPCPVPKDLCSQAKQITYQGKTLGLGFTLPPNTAITAVFPGTLLNGSQSGGILNVKNHPLRWLKGKGQFAGLIASYNFFGEPVSSFGADKLTRTFSEGENIATTSAQTFPKEEPYSGVSLIFTLTKDDKSSTPAQFEFK